LVEHKQNPPKKRLVTANTNRQKSAQVVENFPHQAKTFQQGTPHPSRNKQSSRLALQPVRNKTPRQGTQTLAGKKQIAQMGITTHQAKEKMPK
jgi:hypothetical protein